MSDFAHVARIDGEVAVDANEALAFERRCHLADGAHIAQSCCTTTTDIRLVTVRFEEVDLAGIRLRNPVGLAAGYDKDCKVLPSLAAMGFGYVTGGTVTESPRPGNPMPRVIRYAEDESLMNSLGFPSKGLDFAARQLERSQPSAAAVTMRTRFFSSAGAVG